MGRINAVIATVFVAAGLGVGRGQDDFDESVVVREWLQGVICEAGVPEESTRCLRNHFGNDEDRVVDADVVDWTDVEHLQTHRENFLWDVFVTGQDVTIRHDASNDHVNLVGNRFELSSSYVTAMQLVEDESLGQGGPFRFKILGVDDDLCVGLGNNQKVHAVPCTEEGTLFEISRYATWRPTQSPVTPSTFAPTRSPTVRQGYVSLKQFLENVILLKSFLDGDLLLGLGISTGDDLLPSLRDKLQLKSFTKNHDKGQLHTLKMVWEHDQYYQLRPTQDALTVNLALGSRKRLPVLNHSPIDMFGYVELMEATNSSAKSSWHFIDYKGGMRILVGNSDGGSDDYISQNFCLTVAACDPHQEMECRPNSALVGCEATCNDERNQRKGIVNGTYVKLAKCNAEWDEAQVWVRGIPENFLNPEVDSGPEEPETTVATLSPVPRPTEKPTGSGGSGTGADNQPGSNGGGKDLGWFFFFVIGLCILFVLFLIMVFAKRRRQKRKENQDFLKRMEADFFDDDDQEMYNSFETDGLTSSSEGRPTTRDESDDDGTFDSLQQRMINKKRRSSVTFEPHVAHFDEETGFVSRV